MSDLRKLNWGAGSMQPPDWSNCDVEDFGQEYVGSTELFADETFEIVVAHCSLQITEFHDIEKILTELHRILKPGGVLRISLPDIVRGFEAYETGDIDWLPNGEDNIDERFSAWLTWYSTTRSLLTQPALQRKLLAAGFASVAATGFKETAYGTEEIVALDTRHGECFFTESQK